MSSRLTVKIEDMLTYKQICAEELNFEDETSTISGMSDVIGALTVLVLTVLVDDFLGFVIVAGKFFWVGWLLET